MPDTVDIPAPLEMHTETVRPEWIDHNGHMNVAYYVLAFDEAAGALSSYLGIGQEYRNRSGNGTFVGDFHVHYIQEVMEGDPLRFSHRLVDCDEKRVHYWQEMYHAEKGYLAAEAETITLHIDMSARKVAPFPPEVQERITAVYEAHKHLPLPENLGRQIKVRRR
ncbi:MAG: thioesterase-like protein [Alphaproteobacteria bacterium]|nr:thioesterase-like protein [Alphaproteobacteria bacterium]